MRQGALRWPSEDHLSCAAHRPSHRPGHKLRARLGEEPPASLPADFTTRVDGLFAEWNRRDSPGCAIGIVHRGQVIYSKGFGSANLEYQVPNTPQTVFDASVGSPNR